MASVECSLRAKIDSSMLRKSGPKHAVWVILGHTAALLRFICVFAANVAIEGVRALFYFALFWKRSKMYEQLFIDPRVFVFYFDNSKN